MADGRRRLLFLVLGQLGMHAAMAGLRMAAPLQALHEGASPLAVGVLLALFAAAAVLLALHAGRLADRAGYHRPARLAVALTVAGGLAAVLSTFAVGWPRAGLLALAALLAGGGANMGMITIQRAAGQLARTPVERVQVFSWLGIAPAFANVIGPVSAGFAIDAAGFRSAYLLMAALPLAGWMFARRLPPMPPLRAPGGGLRGSAFALLRDTPGLARLLVVNGLLSSCWDVHGFAVPVLGHERGFSASTIGLVLGTFTLSVTLVRFAVPALAHRLREITVIRAAMVGTALVFAAYPFAARPVEMGVLASLLGITLGVVQPMIMSTLHRLTPEHRQGEAIALRSMALNLGSGVMPLLFGAAGAAVGVGVIFWAAGLAVGCGQWIARRLAPERPGAEPG